MKLKLFGITLFALFAMTAAPIHALVTPQLINYQGRLTNSAGEGLSGTKTITFNIYNAATGGTLIWGPQIFEDVPLVDGYFNVILGETDENGVAIAGAFDAPDRYIEIKYSGNTITPRQQILSAPYALSVDAAGIQNTIQDDQLENVIDREGFHATGNIVADGHITAVNQPRSRVRLSQNKRVDAATPIQWDIADYNAGDAWNAANPERFAAPVDGLYLIQSNIISSDDDCRYNVYYQYGDMKEYLGQWALKKEGNLFNSPSSISIGLQHYMTAESYLAIEPFDGSCTIIGGAPTQNSSVSFVTFSKIQ